MTGSHPCDPFFQLLKISAHRRDPNKVKQQREVGIRNLHTAIDFYELQYKNNRYFLHEQPEGADSWDDEKMIALQSKLGVCTIMGPMCHWNMEVVDRLGNVGTPRKRTKWVTNSIELATAPDVRCQNELGDGPHHIHLHLINGLACQAAKYPPKLVRAVLKAIKAQMKADGGSKDSKMKFGGPDPTEELFDSEYCDKWIDEAFGGESYSYR